MTSDVEDLTAFYAGLPSIFDDNAPSHNTIVSTVTNEKSYPPIFGSFLFTDSDPLSRAAFVVTSSPSIGIETNRHEQLMDDCASSDENNISSSIQTASPVPISNIDDMDEDDFDGIPIRHASTIGKTNLNGDIDSISNHSKHDQQFDELIDRIDNTMHDDHDMEEDDAFLNGFTDEERETTDIVPSLFKDIPDIDDPNQPEDDEEEGIPFDHMDMSDQSNSIRSSSPDSLLSSSHLRDEQDDIDVDQEVEQWNDDHLLDTKTTNINPPRNLQIHPFDQVDFIDSSPSNSRCSNVSSHLSVGYADQARQFLSDEELATSSDSDNDADDLNKNDTLNHDENDEDICLQVHLDHPRSLSPISQSNSTRSTPSIPDETPIVDIDQGDTESTDRPIAPIAALDDDEDEGLEPFISDQPIFPPYVNSDIKNLLQLKTEQRQNNIVHDIIHMQHLFNENNHDDEFIAIMHNPKIFEEVLYEDIPKSSELAKQTNSIPSAFRPSAQLSIDNKIKIEPFEHCQNIQQTSSLLESKNETTTDFSLIPRQTTTNSSSPDVNHLNKEEKENNALMNVASTTDILQKKQKKIAALYSSNTSEIDVEQQVINEEKFYPMTESDNNNSDDDCELFQILSQIHGIINPTSSLKETNHLELYPSSSSSPHPHPDINEEKTSSNLNDGNGTELLNDNKQVRRPLIPSSLFVINTRKQTDEEQKEKNEKNSIFHENHNDVRGDETQKEREEEEEKTAATTFFSSTSSTSSTLFIDDDSHSLDPDASYSLPNLLLLPLENHHHHQSIEISNQLMTDDLQISPIKTNMNHLPDDDELTPQTTTNPFDPFAPTITNMFETTEENQVNVNSSQTLANFNFDDLWNQSMSDIDSSNHQIDPNAFSWDAFLNNNTEKTNPTNITWESLFGDEQEKEEEKHDLKEYLNWILDHLNESESHITYTSTQNLESIVKDIQMSTLPFEPMPSPPLHVDHTVANPLINAIHHDLFPIDELEQPNTTQGQQSMILYEEDEDQEEEEEEEQQQQQQASPLISFDDEVKPIIDKLVADTLQLALTELNEPYQPVEHFVDQILTQAIFEVYQEDQTSTENDANVPIMTENLASIISWHDQTQATNQKLPDPFDQKFDSVWSSHFQAPDDQTHENFFDNENKETSDPWLMNTPNKEIESMPTFSRAFDDSDLFSSSSNPTNKNQEIEDDDSTVLSEYLPPSILNNPSNTTAATKDFMKYTFTAPVMDDSGDDSLPLDESFFSRQNETNSKANEQSVEAKNIISEGRKEIETNEEENFFSNNARSSQFKAFASDQPLHTPDLAANFANITAQFDEEFNESSPNDVNAPWTSIEKPIEITKSSGIGDDEPWELEDNGEEKITPVPTTIRLATAFDDNEYSTIAKVNSKNNFFSDAFTLNDESEQTLAKSVRFDDNIQDIQAAGPTNENRESSSTSQSDEIEVEDIKPTFETMNNRMETSYVHIDKKDFTTEHPYESLELAPQTDHIESAKLNTLNDHIPLQTVLPLSNTETEYQTNLRSEPAITTDTHLVRPYESAILRSTSKDDTNEDLDEVNGVISCLIDQTPVNIDAKVIEPFKCVINSAGTLNEDNQTAVITIYGCALPDHRLREYRYIMDQLFYYVYHKLEKLVINDYVLIYFHGATSKHRTPDLKFLRKCYQMINFRLRKNLRSVYVVHPTRWLRTVIALSRPFFSKKFYHKINYIYTIAELERQFPRNRLSIPATIEQTDWLYSQKYDRDNPSINRSKTSSMSRSIMDNEDESTA